MSTNCSNLLEKSANIQYDDIIKVAFKFIPKASLMNWMNGDSGKFAS
jgi:hypothetical protein